MVKRTLIKNMVINFYDYFFIFYMTTEIDANNENIILKYPKLNQFFSKNASIKHFIILTENSENDNNLNKLKFSVSRRNTHELIVNDLTKYIKKLNLIIKSLKKEIEDLSEPKQNLIVKCFDFDRIQAVMIARELIVIRRKLQKIKTSLATRKFIIFNDALDMTKKLMFLYTNYVIPNDVKCQIDTSFFDIKFGKEVNHDIKKIEYLNACEARLNGCINTLPKALWSTNFSKFFICLISNALQLLDPELSYCPPLELEISLSRCLFHPGSKFTPLIDNFLKTNFNSDSFVDKLIDFCYDFLYKYVSIKTVSINLQSAALVLLYRIFFNRCYEKHWDFFANRQYLNSIRKPSGKDGLIVTGKNHENDNSFFSNEERMSVLKKIEKLKHVFASKFPLPEMYIRPGFLSKTIKDAFLEDPLYKEAALYFNLSQFHSNPLDALFDIHKALSTIHKGAITNSLLNGVSTSSLTNDNINEKEVLNGDENKQLLSFDDLFSLFFGTMMAADLHDLFDLATFINKYSPKLCLSPTFEYAQANMEALVLYCINIQEM